MEACLIPFLILKALLQVFPNLRRFNESHTNVEVEKRGT